MEEHRIKNPPVVFPPGTPGNPNPPEPCVEAPKPLPKKKPKKGA